MASFLQQIEDKRMVYHIHTSDVGTIAYNDELTFTEINSVNDSTFNSNGVNSVWSLFNLYSSKNFNELNVNYSDGGLIDTALEPLLNAYNDYGMIMFQNSNFRKMINGQNIEIKIPLDSTYTGATSGLTATTLYSSFIDDDNVKVKSTDSVCDGFVIDSLYEEPSTEWTDGKGIGYKYDASNEFHESDVVFLMSNDTVGFSGATGTSKDWSDGYKINNKYTYDKAPLITPTGLDRDTIAGVVFLRSGTGFIFDEHFVKGFDFVGSTGGTGTTGVHFTGNQAYMNASDIDTKTALQVDLILKPENFTTSLNPSYVEDSLVNGSNCDVAFNTITLHDNSGECLVVAKASEPILKPEGEYSVITLDIPIGGGVQDSLADTRGIIYP